MVTSPRNRNCGESAWDEWGSVLGCRGRSGEVWEEVWGGAGKCFGVRGEIRKDVWGVEKCGRVYGVSGEGVRECMGRGSVLAYGKRMCVGKCVRVWGPNTLSHISFLTSPFPTSPLSSPLPNTLSYTSLLNLFPHLAPHPNTFSYYPHISPHLLKVWRSYHVAKLLATGAFDPKTSNI